MFGSLVPLGGVTDFVHLTASLAPGRPELLAPERAAWLWGRLRAVFPGALAACLMPRHVHLVVPAAGDPQSALRRTLAWYGRRFPVADVRAGAFLPVPPPTPIADAGKLARQIRYVHLNPCRGSHCDDPLRWQWSTHRDLVGATADPWVTPDAVAAALGRSRAGFEASFHAYVSGDPSVNPAGTPPPEPPEPGDAPLADLVTAVAAALRLALSDVPRSRLGRRLVAHLAPEFGWPRPAPVAAVLGVAPATLHKIRLRHPDPPDLEAARLCLGDPRLLHPRP